MLRLPLASTAAALAALSFASSALSTPKPLLAYSFNESTASYPSVGTWPITLRGFGEKQKAGAPGSGVSGRTDDRAWDASANEGQGTSQPLNSSGLVAAQPGPELAGLKAFTLSFWFKTEQSFAQDSATRFLMLSDRPAEPVSRGMVLRSHRGALELRIGGISPEGEGTPMEVVVASTRFREGVGYHRTHTWVFVAITWDGSEVHFHVGDARAAIASAGSGPFVGRIVEEQANLVLCNTRALNRGLDGWLDNFRFHDVALSIADLDALRRTDLGQP